MGFGGYKYNEKMSILATFWESLLKINLLFSEIPNIYFCSFTIDSVLAQLVLELSCEDVCLPDAKLLEGVN